MPEIKLVYEQIKEYIKAKAKAGKPGDYLSSEVQYSTLFGVSRPTVRKAVDELADEGLVRRIPGKGLIAADPLEKSSSFKNNQSGKMIAIIIPFEPGDGFFYNMAMGCVDASNSRRYGYSIFNHRSAEEKLKILDEIKRGSYSGAILTAYNTEADIQFLSELKAMNMPFVLLDNPVENMDTPYVITNDYKGGYMACEYLIKHGHRNILYLTLDMDVHTVKQREKGHLKALKDYSIELPPDYIINLHVNEDIFKVFPSIDPVFPSVGLPYTAICSYSDLPVIMAYNTLTDMGINIPGDVSLFGYGNFKLSELLKVPLSTISMPVYEMGNTAVGMLADHIEGKTGLGKIMLDVQIIERNSVACFKGSDSSDK